MAYCRNLSAGRHPLAEDDGRSSGTEGNDEDDLVGPASLLGAAKPPGEPLRALVHSCLIA